MLALVAGGSALIALIGLWIVSFQSGAMRGNSVPDFSPYPLQTVVAVRDKVISAYQDILRMPI